MRRAVALFASNVTTSIENLANELDSAGWNPFVVDGSQQTVESFATMLDEQGALVAHFHHDGGADLSPFVQRASTLGVPNLLTLHSQAPPELEAVFHLCESVGGSNTDASSFTAAYHSAAGDLLPPVTDKRITAVISTYNKPQLLRRALEGFVNQTLSQEQYEVIVVDDCSTVDVASVVAEFEDRLPLVFVRHETNKGLGETRNTAVARASGDIVAFFDDDNIVGPRLLAEHLRTHVEYPQENFAALAFTGLHSSVEITNVLWAVTQTLQTYLSSQWMHHGDQLPWHCAWGGCSSFKISLLRRYEYEVAWMEDMDLAWRMRAESIVVVHNRHAVQYIAETETVESWKTRSRRQGRAAALLAARHSEPEFQAYLGASTAKSNLIALEPQVEKANSVIARFDQIPREQLENDAVEYNGLFVAQHAALEDAYRIVFEYERLNEYIAAAIELGNEEPRATGKRILVIDVLFPMADRASGAKRLRHLLELMVDEGHEVTFLAMNGENQARYVSELRALGINTVANDPARLATAFGAPSSGQPAFDIGRLLTEHKFDIAFIEFYYVAEQYIPEIRRWSPNTRIILDSVDIHYVRERRQAAIAGDTEMAAKSETTKRREQAAYSQADDVIAITEADRAALLELVPGAKTAILPNLHDSTPMTNSFGNRKGLLFVGNFVHPPNADGITWFASAIWPQVQRAIPNIELTVVGADPPASLNNVRGINVVGYVPSMIPFLSDARLSIAPLRSGAGMKGKVGEALGAGLPVIATSVASEGMHLTSGDNVVIADDADGFAQAIIRSYNDKALWTKLSNNGRRLVDAMYGTKAVRELLNQVLDARSDEAQLFVTVPDWNDLTDLQNALAEYTNNFGPSDAVSLVVGVQNYDLNEATEKVIDALTQLGLDPTNIADVEITPWNSSSATRLPENAVWLNTAPNNL